MAHTITATLFDRPRLARVADWLAVGVAVAMPWSISISQILTVAWLVALIPTLDVGLIRRDLQNPAGGLSVLLWLLALAGILPCILLINVRAAAVAIVDHQDGYARAIGQRDRQHIDFG